LVDFSTNISSSSRANSSIIFSIFCFFICCRILHLFLLFLLGIFPCFFSVPFFLAVSLRAVMRRGDGGFEVAENAGEQR
jgi:hypothetical protein